MYKIKYENYVKLSQIDSGFLLSFEIASHISYHDIILKIKEYFPNRKIYENFPRFIRIETPSEYLIPNFPDSLYDSKMFEKVYKFESFPLILASLYFYKLLGFNFACEIQFKNRYGNTPSKIDLLRNHIPKEFTKIMEDAGHEIKYGILLNTLNSFNPYITTKDFLLNLDLNNKGIFEE